MGALPTKTMAELFVAASERWTKRAPVEAMPDFHAWCAKGGLLGTGPGQFQPAFGSSAAATDPGFPDGASVTFVDDSVAVRDLDELRHGRTARWRALAPLSEEFIRRFLERLL